MGQRPRRTFHARWCASGARYLWMVSSIKKTAACLVYTKKMVLKISEVPLHNQPVQLSFIFSAAFPLLMLE
jgi:hypothetical protein